MPGARIGQDGFGYLPGAGGHGKVPQVGRVIIQDGVEIGANTTIDRGAIRDTVIGEGTKIDNLVQIAHNVEIGRHCVLAAHTGISGSCTIGDYVMMGGRVGIADNITVGAGAMIAAGSGVMSTFRRARNGAARPRSRRAIGSRRNAALRRARAAYAKPDGGERMTGATIEAAGIKEILESLPHRYPFLMVDRVIVDARRRVRNRHQERDLQRAAVHGALSRQSGVSRRADDRGHGADRRRDVHRLRRGRARPKAVFFMTIDKAKFRKPVGPGDVIEYHMKKKARRKTMWWYRGEAKVGGELVAEAEVGAMLIEA